jgi:phage shock protein PspC (stress-responsive transcriptional regulator)
MDFSKLPKSKGNILAGVAAGIAEYQGISKITVRVFFFLTALFTGGLAIIAYSILAFLMPPPQR